jgi:predicted RNA-binding Zn ribbon-like protein
MLALALANTAADVDVLATPAELTDWLSGNQVALGSVDDEVALRLADFRSLRNAIRGAMSARLRGVSPSADALRALNEASAAVPTAPALEDSRSGPVRVERVTASPSRTVQILATIARSAIELLGGPDHDRLRLCPATRCGKAFLASRGRQVWCSASCGNRMRVARHHARRASAADPLGG